MLEIDHKKEISDSQQQLNATLLKLQTQQQAHASRSKDSQAQLEHTRQLLEQKSILITKLQDQLHFNQKQLKDAYEKINT